MFYTYRLYVTDNSNIHLLNENLGFKYHYCFSHFEIKFQFNFVTLDQIRPYNIQQYSTVLLTSG